MANNQDRVDEINKIYDLTEKIIILKKLVNIDTFHHEETVRRRNYPVSYTATAFCTVHLPKDTKFKLSWVSDKYFTQNELRKVLSNTKQELKEHQKKLSKIETELGIDKINARKGCDEKIKKLNDDIELKRKELEQLETALRKLEADANDMRIIRRCL